jgi:hypothetical protein
LNSRVRLKVFSWCEDGRIKTDFEGLWVKLAVMVLTVGRRVGGEKGADADGLCEPFSWLMTDFIGAPVVLLQFRMYKF